MKQRVVRIALIALVLAVWGAVVARAVRRPAEQNMASPLGTVEVLDSHGPDTSTTIAFTLARDPFLGDGVRPAAYTSRESHASQVGPVTHRAAQSPSTPLPSSANKNSVVEYLGFLKRTGPSGKACAILRIDGRTEVIAIGGMAAGIAVRSATAEAVVIDREGVEERVVRGGR